MFESSGEATVSGSTRIAALLQRASRIACVAVGLIGIAGLLSWMFGIAMLKQIEPGPATMKINTALCLIGGAVALASLHMPADRRIVWFGRACAVFVAATGMLTLCEYLFGWDAGIDQLLFTDRESSVFPGRMSMIAALSFVLFGIALLLTDAQMLYWRLASTLTVVGLLLGWMVIIAYIYDVTSVALFFPFSTVAAHTALGLVILGGGILLARPTRGLAALIANSSPAGIMARRLLPVAILSPLLLGWLRWQGQLAGLYDTEFGLVIMVTGLTAVLALFVWWNARSLGRLDRERAQTAQALAASEELLRATFEQAAVGIARVGLDGQWLQVNQKLCEIVGYSRVDLMNRTFQSITYPDDLESDLEYVRETLAGLRSTYVIEKRYIRNDSSIVWANLTVSLVRESEGEPSYFISVVEDISERKRAEAALRESEERLSGIVGSAMDAIISVDEARNILLFNAAAEQMFHCSASEVLGQPMDRFVPAPLRTIHGRHIQHFGATGVTSRSMHSPGELTAVRADGAEFPIEATISQIAVGGKTLYTVVIRNITERKRAEAALRESEQRFAAAFRFSPVAKAITRVADNKFMDVNDRYIEMLGYSRAELIGHTGGELNIVVDPNDRAAIIQQLKEHGAIRNRETTVRSKSGRIHDVLASIEMTEIGGEACNLVILFDISERKQSERAIQRYTERLTRLREIDHAILAAGSVEGIARASIDHIRRLIPSMRASIMLLDYQAQAIVPLAFAGAAEAGDSGNQRRPLEEITPILDTLGNGKVVVVGDILALADRSEALHTMAAEGVRAYLVAPMIALGQLIGMLSIAAGEANAFTQEHIDIALELASQLAIAIDQANLRAQIQRHTADLEEHVAARTAELAVANKELEAFSYSVSHDLRAPLRAIAGFTRILVEDFLGQMPEESHEYLLLVRDNAQQMNRLINDLLAFSRLGRQPLSKQLVAPSELVRQIIADLSVDLAGRKVEFAIGTLPTCLADPSLLRQVYVNLLTNALKFTGKRAVAQIEVGARAAPGQPAQTVYFVKDNGAGFDLRYADKLFHVFQRLHRAEEYEGTGVGLAIVQRIIYRHGGRVWAEAEVDQGATFFFTLGGS